MNSSTERGLHLVDYLRELWNGELPTHIRRRDGGRTKDGPLMTGQSYLEPPRRDILPMQRGCKAGGVA
jgi:hypothetical protein